MKNLKSIRKNKGISQAQLAAAIGVTQGTISQWESGYTNPSICSAKAIAAFLGVTVDELIGGNDDEGRI